MILGPRSDMVVDTEIPLDRRFGGCVVDDTVLTAQVQSALARGLPVLGSHPVHAGVAVLVGSGPSVAGELDKLRYQRAHFHRPIFAMNAAHAWLISHDLLPDYAIAIDPSPHVQRWFPVPSPSVKYFIASQCHPSTFDHLAGCPVWVWHLEFNDGKAFPPDTVRIGGGTTVGLRAITLLYNMGFRRFALYGYDSCLQHGALRVTGEGPDTNVIVPVRVGERVFLCDPEMSIQAHGFQKILKTMPDIVVHAYGDGLIAAILKERACKSS